MFLPLWLALFRYLLSVSIASLLPHPCPRCEGCSEVIHFPGQCRERNPFYENLLNRLDDFFHCGVSRPVCLEEHPGTEAKAWPEPRCSRRREHVKSSLCGEAVFQTPCAPGA
ncbi:hypothetical protein NDU88_003243 [Pleurodeles waltl]|uniref:Secreted protein n=1 Tax=Pleurodeles waltl TaxID=8319 RepID=A0AAV7TN22_PLEWA|nr:hypothetical protein NDU88_003243 [Pleurodeles waltl]